MFGGKSLEKQNSITAFFARLSADFNDRDCTTASLIEIATTNKSRRVPTLSEVRSVVPRIKTAPYGVTDTVNNIQTIKNGSKLIGVPISRILLTEGVADIVNVPKSLRRITHVVVGEIEPRLPRIVMLDDGGIEDGWGHVESEVDEKGTRRIDKQLKMGRKPVIVVEFKKLK